MTDDYTLPWNVEQAEVVRGLEALLDAPGVPADFVRARLAILKAQGETLDALGGFGGVGRPAPDVAGPLVQPGTVGFDQTLAAGLLAAVIDACRKHGGGAADLERIAAAVGRRPGLVEDLALCVALEPEPVHLGLLSHETGAPRELLVLLARLVAAPLVVDAARRLEELPDVAAPCGGSCPMCGSPPGPATLGEDGHRVLHCGLCGWSWRFARLACPGCGCEEGARLERLSVDGEDVRWIEACGECKGYVKTIDRRRLGESTGFVVLAEEVATLYLDLLAEREGYEGRPPYAAMV